METWFLVLFFVVMVVAVLSKSYLASFALIGMCVLGWHYSMNMSVSLDIRYGVGIIFLCGIGYSVFQMLFRAEHI